MCLGVTGGRQGAPAPRQDVVRAKRGLSQSKKKPKPTGAIEEAAENRAGKATGSLPGTERLREQRGDQGGVGE